MWNKVDLDPMPAGAPVGSVAVSAMTGEGMDRLIAGIHGRLAGRLGEEPGLITRARHRDAVAACHSEMVAAGEMLGTGTLELAAEHLRQAARAVERLLGRIDTEEVLDLVFREFCVGK